MIGVAGMRQTAHGEAERDRHYRHVLRELQIELVEFQRRPISHRQRVVVVIEGRDAAGTDGTIKHVIEHLAR